MTGTLPEAPTHASLLARRTPQVDSEEAAE